MVRRDEQEQRAVSPGLPGISITDTATFVKDCRSKIAEVLGNKYLGLTKIELHGSEQYFLSGADVIQIEGDRNYKAIPFYISDFTKFWLAVALKVESRERKQYLTSISIVIFRGNFTDEKIPLLRAEWDCSSEIRNSPHAQPHWHVYSSRFREREDGNLALERVPEAKDFDANEANLGLKEASLPKLWEEGEKFHFAMAATWAKLGKGAHYEDVEVAGVVRWIEGCISYILAQFQFLYPTLPDLK